MSISTIPAPLTTSVPAGATSIVFSGSSSASDYTHPSTIPSGVYIISYSGFGTTYIDTTNNSDITLTSGTNFSYIKLNTNETVFTIYSSWTPVTETSVVPDVSFLTLDGTTFFTRASSLFYTSTNGVTWSSYATPAFNVSEPIVYNANVTNKWLAVNTSTNVATSTDRITWTTRNTNNGSNINGVAINSAVTNKFVAVGGISNNSFVSSSTDGVTWTSRSFQNSTGQQTYSMTTSGLGTGQAYVVGRYNDFQTSTDGVTWTQRTSAGSPIGLNYLTYGNGNYICLIQGNNTQYQSSTDGITWTLRTNPGGLGISRFKYTNNLFYATQGRQVSTSTNGITWSTPRTLLPDTESEYIEDNGTIKIAYSRASANRRFYSPATSFYTLYGSAGTTLN